jgi:hypothetical protein
MGQTLGAKDVDEGETMTPVHYHVIFRTCDAIQALRGKRPFGLDKRTLIKDCFTSLHDSLSAFSHSIHILGDKLSPELLAYFEGWQKIDPSITISNGSYGNDESLRQSLQRAFERPDSDWIYLCEDDYLHTPQAFERINELIMNRDTVLAYKPRRSFMKWFLGDLTKKPLVIHPADYPDRYRTDQKTLSFLFMTPQSHWRQIANTTFTILAQGSTFRRYRKDLWKSTEGANDDYLSHYVLERLPYRDRALCVSPIPGLATHMHEDVMTPLVDWESIHLRVASRRQAEAQG